jgi:molecular chaperone GrpE (heat shock protein)
VKSEEAMKDEENRDEGVEVPVRVVDRRRFHETDDGEIEPSPDATGSPSDRRPAYVQELEERLAQSEQRVQETLAAHRQRMEEFDQVRARLERDVESRVEEARARTYCRILDVVDEMERALEAADTADGADSSLAEGLRLIHRKLSSTLSEEGVERLQLEGEPFDPEVAEAIGVLPVEDAGQHDRVVAVLQAGYRLGSRILRPARVQVGRHRAPEEEAG